ncbi:hypothetical protein [Aureimonas sp. SK2]|uniref:hypothetical protein n=1 Tax=Aureimonas sp. SK2 TaxID=3015992 RepID=UPI002443938B|nr:hypothetical protein [Aureimonas sp. SK2]
MSIPLDASVGADRPSRVSPFSALLSPYAIGAMVLAACAVTLTLHVTLPVGPMYWDLFVYVDGGWRVLTGQMPSVDFFTPVGPLGYWLYAAAMTLFPDGHPLLLAQWMLMPVTLTALLPVLAWIDKRSRRLALALLLPFLVFQLLPTNVEQYSTFPAIDGFGIYNRHMTQILYVLTVALVFERRQRMLFFVIAWTCAALFLTKITGFICAGMLCAFAFAAGRVQFRTALAALLAFALVLAGLEAAFGVVSAYVQDILTLVRLNENIILVRFIQASSLHFGVVGTGALLLLALLWVDRKGLVAAASNAVRQPLQGARWAALFDRDVLWLGVALFVGIFCETQNTGSQAFIFLWPILLRIACNASLHSTRATTAILVLVAAVAMPPIVNVVHRTSRALVVQIKYDHVPLEELRALDTVSQRTEMTERADKMLLHYSRFPEAYQALADMKELPTFWLYSDLDFQSGWMTSTNDAVREIRAYEAAHNVRFETIMSLNFTNVFPYAMERRATPYIAIGADPFRAVPPASARTTEAVRQTDLIMMPLCPITVANEMLHDVYREGMKDHVRVSLSPCWDAYIRPDLANR